MALKYHPGQRSVVICDYKGFRAPEMIKPRPVVVLTARSRSRKGLCTIVPLSTTKGRDSAKFEVEITFDRPLPRPFDAQPCWAKCDLVFTSSLERLEMFRTGRGNEGKRKYFSPKITEIDLQNIQQGVINALGLSALTQSSE